MLNIFAHLAYFIFGAIGHTPGTNCQPGISYFLRLANWDPAHVTTELWIKECKITQKLPFFSGVKRAIYAMAIFCYTFDLPILFEEKKGKYDSRNGMIDASQPCPVICIHNHPCLLAHDESGANTGHVKRELLPPYYYCISQNSIYFWNSWVRYGPTLTQPFFHVYTYIYENDTVHAIIKGDCVSRDFVTVSNWQEFQPFQNWMRRSFHSEMDS